MKSEVPNPEQMSPDLVAFTTAMDRVARDIPEAAEHRERIRTGGAELVKDLEIASEFFDDKLHSLFFGVLADRNGRLEQEKSRMTADRYTAEKAFIFNAAVLLVGKKSGLYPQLKDQISIGEHIPDETLERVCDRFTNKQITAELKQAIEERGLLSDVKRRLHVTPETEDEYDLRVLNIASEGALFGMHPSSPRGSEGYIFDDELRARYLADVRLYDGYANGLLANGGDFRKQVGMQTDLPLAWSWRLENGKRYLCITLPTAEKILYPEEVRNTRYVERHLAQEFAILEHEYAHTQGGYLVDDKLFYGVGLEEYRAEQAAGNKMAYEDTKGFINIDLPLLTGVTLATEMARAPKGIEAHELYSFLAKRMGMQAMLEFALTTPGTYIEKSRPIQAEVQKYLGGYDGLSRRLYEGADPKERTRIDAMLARFGGRYKDDPGQLQWIHMRKAYHGLNYISDKMLAALDAAKAK